MAGGVLKTLDHVTMWTMACWLRHRAGSMTLAGLQPICNR